MDAFICVKILNSMKELYGEEFIDEQEYMYTKKEKKEK